MVYLLVFFISLISTLFLTPYFISYLRKINVVDIPGGRRINTKIVPRMGGLIIFLVVLVILNTFSEDVNSISQFITAVSILMFCGIIDDVIGLKSVIKLILQILSAFILVLYFEPFFTQITWFEIVIPQSIEKLFLLFFIVGAINSINLLDGLDGLASGFSLLIFSIILTLAIVSKDSFLILLTVSLVGSLLGFLRFNAFPASIFLGDTGSLVLGSFLIIAAIKTSLNFEGNVLDLTFPTMLLAVPMIDTAKVFVYRLIHKKSPFQADNSHLHHIIYHSNVKHEVTVFIIEIFTFIYVILSLFYLRGFKNWTIAIFVAFALILIFIKPILSTFSKSQRIFSYYRLLREFPLTHIIEIARGLIYFSSVLILFIIIFSFSVTTTLKGSELIFLIITCISLLVLAYLQQKKSKKVNHLNVFLNFSIFFLVSKLSLPNFISVFENKYLFQGFHDFSFYLLAVFISIAMFARWKSTEKKEFLFSGIDLTMIVFILLFYFANKFYQFDFNYYLSVSLLEAFIIYIWYKIIIEFKSYVAKSFAYFSFVLPLISLVLLLVLK